MKKTDSTKEKILKVANDLFAKNGFAATTVRDIAQRAEVNLAAINYHFQNKESLYWAVFSWNHFDIDQKIENLGQQSITTAELTKNVFRLFVEEKSALMNTFKIFLSDNIKLPENNLNDDLDQFGPPGERAFLEKIYSDLGDNLPEDAAYWIMKMIFSLLVHFGVMINTKVFEMKHAQDLGLTYKSIEDMLIHSLHAHMVYAKDHADEIVVVKCSNN